MPFRNPMLAVGVFAISASGALAQTTAPALTALNNAFRAAYADARSRVLASSGPTLIVNGDNFALLRDGRRVEANVGTPIYDPVKTIAHIPLAIYVTLTPGDGARRRRSPQDPRGPARTHPARRGQPRHPETPRRHARPPEEDRGRLAGFPRRCGRQA